MQVGDWVKLVRKYTGEPMIVTLIDVTVTNTRPCVEVEWRPDNGVGVERFKLDLEKNQVLAIDASVRHRQAIKAWYTIDEADRIALTKLFWDKRKLRRK